MRAKSKGVSPANLNSNTEVFANVHAIVSLWIISTMSLLCLNFAHSAEEKPEFRAMWISSYGPNCDMASPKSIDKLIADAKAAHLNALVVQVRKTGDALYKSSYEPKPEDMNLGDFDPLAYIINKAHANGIEVHAWINTFKIWQGGNPPKNPNHVYNKHPEWINRTRDGVTAKGRTYGLDPGIRAVTEYTKNIYLDVVKKYDVDGIHFDYVRYWDPYFGYTSLALERFKKETGRTDIPDAFDPQWCQWRRDRVTDLVREVYEGVKKIKPWVRVTGSVVCSGDYYSDFTKTRPYTLLLQEWNRWLREGIIDAVIPMNYKSESNPTEAKQFRDWTAGMVSLKSGRHVYNGLMIRGATDLITQIKESRKAGTDGTCGFTFNASPNRTALASALRSQVYQTWVTTPPMPWKPPLPARTIAKPLSPKELFDKAIQLAATDKGLDEAITLLQQVVAEDPNMTEAHFRLGRCYLRKGMKTEAADEFRQTLELDASHKGAEEELRKLQAAE